MKVSNILLLGAGSIGKRHLANIRKLRPQANIVVYDPVATIAPDQKVLLVRDDPFSFSVDCAVIASPTEFHYDQILILVHKYVPVYIEKPICNLNQLGRSMTALANSMIENKSTCGFQYRFHPNIEKYCRHWRRNGEAHFLASDNLISRYGRDVEGIIAAHPFDTACFLFGKPNRENLYSDGERLIGWIEHENGVSQHTCNINGSERQSCVISGGKKYDLPRDDGMYVSAMKAWLECVETGERDPMLSTLNDGVTVTEIISQCKAI